MSSSLAAEPIAPDSADPEEILGRMLALSELALARLTEGDEEALKSALLECERLAERADPLLARYHVTSRSQSPAGEATSTGSRAILESAQRLREVNARLTAAVERRSLELARSLRLIDDSPIVLDAYGQSAARSRRRIDFFR